MDIHQEKGDSGKTVSFINDNLQSINQQLNALHLQIHEVKKNRNSCKDSGATFDAMMAEEKAAREKCSSLQKEVTELLDRVKYKNTLSEKYNSMTAAKDRLYRYQNTLLEKLQHLKEKDGKCLEDGIKELEEKCKAARREGMGLKVRIRALQAEIDLEMEMEESFQKNEAMRNTIEQLKARREQIISKTIIQQNENLQFGIEELHKEILSETTLKKLFDHMEISEKTMVQQNMTMQQKHHDLKRKHNDLRVWGDR